MSLINPVNLIISLENKILREKKKKGRKFAIPILNNNLLLYISILLS
jgi:hypothetical protein